jgi:hypothetical protein
VLNGYLWRSSDSSVVDVVASGQMAVFYGKRTGTAKITVTSDACDYPLEIIANCVDPVLAANNPYIASQNIITLTVGDSPSILAAELVGGLPSDTTGFFWQIADSSVASLYANNDTAQIKALKEGVTQVVISHPKAGGVDRAVLVICEPRPAADCYITTAESIIRMSPSDSSRTLTAALVNGTAADAYTFKWWADSYDCIDLNYAGASANITPIAAGTTTVHISHPKAQYQKDIVIYVSQYSELKFAQTSLSVAAGQQTFVTMQVPVTNLETKVSYSAALPGGGSASHIVSASGTNAVCIINAHEPGTATVTASLVAVNSGIVQATAELLVNVTPSSSPSAYINFSGSTIITVEKGVTRNFSATLAGQGATDQDSKSIRWVSSDPAVLKLSPSSLSGVAVNNEIQAAALRSGEVTVTVSHEKAASNIILYVIIPGENVAAVSLDRSLINMMTGENPQVLTATLTNAQKDDPKRLEWSVEQDGEVIKISGSGNRVNILPVSAGAAVVTVKVPSSGQTASCAVTVEQAHAVTFPYKNLTLFPGEQAVINYSVSLASRTGDVIWTLSDSAYIQIGNDDHEGRLTVYAKKEGQTTLTAASASGATATMVITVRWAHTLTLDKQLIRSVPVDNGDGTFDMKYQVSPPVSQIRVSGVNTGEIILKPGTYSGYSAGEYIIGPEFHTAVDEQTGVASGVIRFSPVAETLAPVTVSGYNPAYQNTQGQSEPRTFGAVSLQMQIYYASYTILLQNFARISGNFSRFDPATGALILGDGETVQFTVGTAEPGANPLITGVSLVNPVKTDSPPQADLLVPAPPNQLYPYSGNTFRITHSKDYYLEYGNPDPAYADNDTVLAIPLACTVRVEYAIRDSGGAKKYFDFPLYVEVRNCSKNY